MRAPFASLLRILSPGAAVVIALALVSSVVVWRMKVEPRDGMLFWVFAPTHFETYQRSVPAWNREHPESKLTMAQLSGPALEQRLVSGFFSGTPLADVFEVERVMAAKAFTGPLEDVGFLDVTDRLHEEGLFDQINAPSFSPWMSRGRIFGIPHDVHPVMLAYRADLVEAAGIDVSSIETWEDYFRLLRPLQEDLNGDGRPDRWLLNAGDTNVEVMQMLLYQAGGTYFDEQDRPILNDSRNAAILARLVTWFTGPNRVSTDLGISSALTNQQILNGTVIGCFLADWTAGSWRMELPGLAGKVKLMPLPAWEQGGRRTSVWGGTMMAINRRSPRTDEAWEFAKELYLSPENAAALFRKTMIITPVKSLWNLPVFDEPDAYYSGQRVGRMLIDLAPDVPPRPSSPYATMAQQLMGNTLIELRAYADQHELYTEEALMPEARRLLEIAQGRLAREIGRNSFLTAKEAP